MMSQVSTVYTYITTINSKRANLKKKIGDWQNHELNRSRELREHFMHSNGTTALDTLSPIVMSFLYNCTAILSVSILHSYGFRGYDKIQFLVEFVTLVLPIILNVTVLSLHSLDLAVYFTITCVTLAVILCSVSPKTEPNEKSPMSADLKSRGALSNTRSTINMISVIAILAVDFLIFPRRYAKTIHFGYSLMDTGVGFFIFINGAMESGRSAGLAKSVKSALPLLALGLVRMVITKQIDYHVPVLEYGTHWNFFLTLAVLKIFVPPLFNVFTINYTWINSLLLIFSHEVLLQTGLQNFVTDKSVKRDNFIKANREGLVSSFGFVGLYLLSAWWGYFLDARNATKAANKKRVHMKFAALAFVLLTLTVVLERFTGISRQLTNSAYCFWVLFISTLMFWLFCLFDQILVYMSATTKNCFIIRSTLIYEAINYNGLAFFLLANLLTGIINLTFDTLQMDSSSSLIIICCYMVVNCGVMCFLYKRQIKLKL